jgi:hypothetical protein
MANSDFEITILCADIVTFAADVVALKYAQGLHGADQAMAQAMSAKPTPAPGEHVWLAARNRVAAGQVLFVGTPSVFRLNYQDIRDFAGRALAVIGREAPATLHVAMTVHGVNVGLDEREAFMAQLAGLLDARKNDLLPPFLERVTIVEKNQKRATRLQQLLDLLPVAQKSMGSRSSSGAQSQLNQAGQQSQTKPHIFVAMPFGEEMEDTYIFGIQQPVHAAGYLCERVDMSSFTGDILSRIKERIETAALVIADLTGSNPNVYLEVGYAWGKGRPTLLLLRQGENLRFDVQGHRCLFYKNISDLAKKLEDDLGKLTA